MRQGHFFDLDVLISVDNKVWLINKTKPSIPVVKISKSDFNLIKKGIYRKYDQRLIIGGTSYWIPEDLMNRIKIRCKNLKCDITDLAFSMQEFMNPSVIENIDFGINTKNFEHLKNTRDDIYVICSKNSERNYSSIIEKLKDKLADYGLVIKKFYYLSETFYNRDKDDITHKKVRMLLQHLVGLKTDVDKFTDEQIEEYDRVYFYDDDISVIELSKDSNKVFDYIVSNSEDIIKERIKDLIKNDDKVVVVNQITNNKISPFIQTEVNIKWSHIIKTFESFSFINESEYRGTVLPNQEMVEWFEFKFNKEEETLNELESDIFHSEQQREFMNEFRKELEGLSYIERVEVFNKAKNNS